MELFAILLSGPFLCTVGLVYAFIIGKITARLAFLVSPLLWISVLLLAASVCEFLGVCAAGPVGLRRAIGPAYYPIHLVLFTLGLPALVNLMRLQTRIPPLSKSYAIGPTCAIYGWALVLMQYAVFEALFGVDGKNGLYPAPGLWGW
jgi:hypothetical protein